MAHVQDAAEDVEARISDEATRQWQTFVQNSLRLRLGQDKFRRYVEELSDRFPIAGHKLATIVVDSQRASGKIVDPRIPIFVEQLLESHIINSYDVLAALFREYSEALESRNGKDTNAYELAANLLDHLMRSFVSANSPRSIPETRYSLLVLSRWLEIVTSAITDSDALMRSLDPDAIVLCDSLGLLAIAMLENVRVSGVIERAITPDQRETLAHSLTIFIPCWAQTSPQQASRLEIAQKHHSLVEDITKAGTDENAIDVAAAMQVEAIMDMTLMHTRAALFILLNSLLVSRPLTDDSAMMNYLHSRYKGDIQNLTIDLIVASFDVLAAAMERHESDEQMFTLKSFHTNKIPLLVSALSSSMFVPLTPEFCISQAMTHVDPTVFPAPSYGMMSNSPLQDVRQEFLFACVLQSLLPAESIEALLGESPYDSAPSPDRRYTKDGLLQQVSSDSDRVSQLIKELENLDGNAGAIVGAVTETIRNACNAKDTMALKSVCNALLSTLKALDVMLQFTSPTSVLQPLCNLLDAWRYDEDQGEYQPVYDEFASIFLVVLAFVYRFGLSHAELGIGRDSFVAKFIVEGSTPIEPLTEEQGKHLERWAKGLFISDGITDEVMSSCRPQQFYLLVPTLFQQTVLADVDLATVKNGLEYLLEPFLLPSLVGAIHWMTTYVWEQTHNDLDKIVEMLKRVTRAPSASVEGQAMHSTIMMIVSQPLARCLRILRRRHPKNTDLEVLIGQADSHSKSLRSNFSPCPELSTWVSAPGSLRHAVQTSLQSLITWSTNVTVNPIQHPPPYNHRQLLIAIQVLGARAVLQILLEEIKARTAPGDPTGTVALDIATTIVCAPMTSSNSPVTIDWPLSPAPIPPRPRGGRLSLRDALNLEFEKATELINTDTLLAESIVRLHRRVEAQLSASNVPPMADLAAAAQMPAILPDLNITGDAQSAVDAAVAVAAHQGTLDFGAGAGAMDLSGADAMGMDLTGDVGTGMDLLGDGGLGTGDDDIFGGLELDDNMDFGLE